MAIHEVDVNEYKIVLNGIDYILKLALVGNSIFISVRQLNNIQLLYSDYYTLQDLRKYCNGFNYIPTIYAAIVKLKAAAELNKIALFENINNNTMDIFFNIPIRNIEYQLALRLKFDKNPRYFDSSTNIYSIKKIPYPKPISRSQISYSNEEENFNTENNKLSQIIQDNYSPPININTNANDEVVDLSNNNPNIQNSYNFNKNGNNLSPQTSLPYVQQIKTNTFDENDALYHSPNIPKPMEPEINQNFNNQNFNNQINQQPLINNRRSPTPSNLDIPQPIIKQKTPIPSAPSNKSLQQSHNPIQSSIPLVNSINMPNNRNQRYIENEKNPMYVTPNFGAFGNPYAMDVTFSSHAPDASLVLGDKNFRTTLSGEPITNSILPYKQTLYQNNYNFEVPQTYGKKIKNFVLNDDDYNELPKYPPLNNSCTYGNLSRLRFSPYGPSLYCPQKLSHGIEQNIIKNFAEIEHVISKIETKLNMPVKLNLLYRASISGDSADAFHNRCDFFDITLVIIETIQGNRFGGFTTRNWNGNLIKKMDSNAFVYSIDRKKTYDVKKNELAIGCYSNCGPVFLGCQIRVFNNFFNVESTTCLRGLNYYTVEDFELNNNQQKFIIKDMEVYEVIGK